jgi:hypothetical protein
MVLPVRPPRPRTPRACPPALPSASPAAAGPRTPPRARRPPPMTNRGPAACFIASSSPSRSRTSSAAAAGTTSTSSPFRFRKPTSPSSFMGIDSPSPSGMASGYTSSTPPVSAVRWNTRSRSSGESRSASGTPTSACNPSNWNGPSRTEVVGTVRFTRSAPGSRSAGFTGAPAGARRRGRAADRHRGAAPPRSRARVWARRARAGAPRRP